MENGRCVYVASPLGFSLFTRGWYDAVLLPGLRVAGWRVSDPWELPAELLEAMTESSRVVSRAAARRLHKVNMQVGKRNENLIRECDALLALLDGSEVDSGTAAEVGFASALGKPVVGLRTDLRLGSDNLGSCVNLQVEYFIERSGGVIVELAAGATNEDLAGLFGTLNTLRGAGGRERPSTKERP